ncbi:hypothetical protein CBR_g51000 [Chara braunii]|uniref:Uncharacterized protein n=1 Tax=Chara braunii TaxID=69332 RepID=A0A388M867_CHABU|nr:hypothetical protein CBR_g51000 [Chara braunii]|eukprot:GBG90652.1 hypothetical protein CBR_g51000 [Chara braunii]
MWGAESAFHKAHREEPNSVNRCEAEEDELTEEEKLYLEKKKAEWSKAKVSARKEKRRVSAYGAGARNAFYPLASNRWVEVMSKVLKGKIWTLETYNFLAPIDVRGYTLLAAIFQDEVRECFDRAMNMVMAPPDVRFPFHGDGVCLPHMSIMDGTKCTSFDPMVSTKGPKPPQNPAPLPELKRIWNVGRLYVKCKCVISGREDCGKGPAWFDHLLWYIFGDPDIMFPDAPTLKAKVRLMLELLEGSWRSLVLASTTFGYMREAMMVLAKKLVADPTLTVESILTGIVGADSKLFKESAKLLMPAKYLKKRSRADVVASSSKRLREEAQTSMDAFVQVPSQGTPLSGQCEMDVESSPPSSAVTTVVGQRVGGPPGLRRGTEGSDSTWRIR